MAEADLSILKMQKTCVCYCTGTVHRTVAFGSFDSPHHKYHTKKEEPSIWMALLFGGAEGNRTPVRKQLDKTFSGCSLLFTFPLPHGNKHPYGIGSFMMRGMGKAYHTHGLHSNDTQARLVDLPGRMRA